MKQRMVATVGLVCRAAFRRQLEAARFMGAGLTYHEVKGWLDSDFHIEGDAHTLRTISNWIDRVNSESPV